MRAGQHCGQSCATAIARRRACAGADGWCPGLPNILPRECVQLFDLCVEKKELRGAQELFGLRPDLTATGKIIGGGFPIGAVAGPAKIMAVFDPREAKPLLPHSGTFNANPITMVAGEVSMRLFDTAEIERLGVLGERARAGMAKAFEDAKFPGQVTGMGSLLRFHVHQRPLVDYRSSLMMPQEKETLSALVRHMRDHGLFVNDRGVCSLSTPMGEEEIDALVEGFRKALRFAGGK